MSLNPPHACTEMRQSLDEEDAPLVYNDSFREYGLRIRDGGSSYVLIQFCPFCGSQLPTSLRDAWFGRLNDMGLDPGDPDVPEELRDGSWWRAK